MFDAHIFEAVKAIKPSWRNELEITDAIQYLVDGGYDVQPHLVSGWWKDTGKIEDILEANRLILETIEGAVAGEVDEASRVSGAVIIEAGAVVRTSTIRGPAIIGAGTEIVGLLHRPVHLDPEAVPDRGHRDRAQHRPRGQRDPGRRQPDRREPDRAGGPHHQVPAQAPRLTGSWSGTRARSGSSEERSAMAAREAQMIDGVKTKNLKVMPDERGRLMEILRRDDEIFLEFGQVYVTTTYPGVVKAWHKHERQSDNIACVAGMIKLAVYDGRAGSPTFREVNEFYLGVHNPLLVQIPAGVHHGWMCVSPEEAVVVNIPDRGLRSGASRRAAARPATPEIPYDWKRKDG